MRSAWGEISTNKLVNIFSAGSGETSIGLAGLSALVFASLARSAWLVCAERATEKNRST